MKRIMMFLTNRKASVVIVCVLCCLLLFAAGLAYGGLQYNKVHSISGGGGTCSGGSFKLTGTIGQPVVGHCSGGPFVVASGFRLRAPRIPGTPSLSTGDLEGWVRDNKEQPISERFRPMVTADTWGQRISTVPDPDGYFLITGLYTGFADVTAKASGYQADTQTVNIVAGTKTELPRWLILKPRSLPSVITLDATDISGDSATLNGELRGLGSIPPVKISFVWGTTSGGPFADPYTEIDLGYRNTTGPFSHSLSGLSEGTTYYFKAQADGVSGVEKSFETMSRPVIPTPPW